MRGERKEDSQAVQHLYVPFGLHTLCLSLTWKTRLYRHRWGWFGGWSRWRLLHHCIALCTSLSWRADLLAAVMLRPLSIATLRYVAENESTFSLLRRIYCLWTRQWNLIILIFVSQMWREQGYLFNHRCERKDYCRFGFGAFFRVSWLCYWLVLIHFWLINQVKIRS